MDGNDAANAGVHAVLGIDGAVQGGMKSRGVLQCNVLHESSTTRPIGERNAGQSISHTSNGIRAPAHLCKRGNAHATVHARATTVPMGALTHSQLLTF